MNKVVKIVGALAVAGAGSVALAGVVLNSQLNGRFDQTFETHDVDLPVPWPLTEAELDALRAERAPPDGAEETEEAAGEGPEEGPEVDVLEGVDLAAIALERAQVRGKHLVEARFACVECHGRDFGGGVMVEDGAMGVWKGPNLTGGQGGVVAEYDISDWDSIVRHGVKRDGTAAMMPSEDFVGMSDRELSDIVAYIGGFPPVDAEIPAPTFGPIGFMLAATGQLPLSAESHAGHTEHPELPPASEVSVEFGKHLSQVCTGCHRTDFSGGPIQVGPPSWPAAGNLTSHAEGLAGWSEEDFIRSMREGNKPDGTPFLEPMTLMTPYAQEMTEVELKALWAYLASLDPKATGT